MNCDQLLTVRRLIDAANTEIHHHPTIINNDKVIHDLKEALKTLESPPEPVIHRFEHKFQVGAE